jgi:crotonobetainyl-CoA:carnitine CoA-transferase CaiB-like acyl-CoA transferase
VKEQRLVPLESAYDEALEGITVVALEQEVAAPFATRQLVDHGARDVCGRRAV